LREQTGSSRFELLIPKVYAVFFFQCLHRRYNKEVGYCQGFNIIAALILQVVDYRADIALKVMIFLIEHVLPRGYFDQSLQALSVDMTVMKDLMLQRVPVTFQHLENLKRSSGLFRKRVRTPVAQHLLHALVSHAVCHVFTKGMRTTIMGRLNVTRI
ncbi:hypothetical protein OESDEN_01638, partial [Oesophagostomum dentatum]